MNDQNKNQGNPVQQPPIQGSTQMDSQYSQQVDPYSIQQDIPPLGEGNASAQGQGVTPVVPQNTYNQSQAQDPVPEPLDTAPTPTFPNFDEQNNGQSMPLHTPQEASKTLTLDDLYGPSVAHDPVPPLSPQEAVDIPQQSNPPPIQEAVVPDPIPVSQQNDPSQPLSLNDLYGSSTNPLPTQEDPVSSNVTLSTQNIATIDESIAQTSLPLSSLPNDPVLDPLQSPKQDQSTLQNQKLGSMLDPKVNNPFPGVSSDMQGFTSGTAPVQPIDPQYQQSQVVSQMPPAVTSQDTSLPMQSSPSEPMPLPTDPQIQPDQFTQPQTVVDGTQSFAENQFTNMNNQPIVTNPQSTPPVLPLANVPSQSTPAGTPPTNNQNTQAFDTSAFEKKKGGGFPKIPKFVFIALGILALLTGVLAAIAFFLRGNSGSNGSLVGTKGELVWWGLTNDQVIVQPLIEEYQSKNPNVKITYIKQTPQEYRERLTNALAGGKGPDIFEIHNTWPIMFQNDLSTLPESVMSKSDYESAFYSVAVRSLNTKNGFIAVPLEYDALGLFVNDDLFLSAALMPPRTWDELRNVVNQTTRVDDTDKRYILVAGIPLGQTDNIDYWQDIIGLMMSQNSVDFRNPEGKPVDDAFFFYNSFDKSWDSSLPRSVQAFARGRSYMLFAPVRATDDIISESPTFIYRTVPIPQLPKEQSDDKDVTYASFFVQSVWKRSANQELAWDFLKFMSSQESLTKLNDARRAQGKQERLYPRPSMNQRFRDDPLLGSFVHVAQNAFTWYLADKTNDGQTGVNTQVASVTEKALKGELGRDVMFVDELKNVLTKYTQTKR